MTKAAAKLLTFDDFITWYGDNERYELIDGELIEMEPTGPHEEVGLRFCETQPCLLERVVDRPQSPVPSP